MKGGSGVGVGLRASSCARGRRGRGIAVGLPRSGRGGESSLRVVVRMAVGCVTLVLWLAVAQAGAAQGWMIRPGLAATVLEGELFAVSCTSSSACTAVGDFSSGAGRKTTLAERWNGVRWAIQSTPMPAGARRGVLQGVSCTSSRACVAVGEFTSRTGIVGTLAERWNGVRWAIRSTPRAARTRYGVFSGVSCTSSRACTAVGLFTGRGRTDVALAERWNGVRWVIQTTPKPSGDNVDFSGVSCASSVACTAVGSSSLAMGETPTQLTPSSFAERWNGRRWAIQDMPFVSHGSGLTGVSCPSSRVCTAVGDGSNAGGPPQLLAERWNGVRWTIQRTPPAAGAVGIIIGGVSCTSSDACTAVGRQLAPGALFADRWNGASWTIQSPPNPAGMSDNILMGVSCTSSSACMAVGSGAYAEQWNGVSWAVQNTLDPTGA
jgi:hypothetical protein